MKLDEIARLAGVSRTTASYVINGKAKQYRVSDKTVEKVMAVVREHNYHPNAVAAGLRAGRTRSIGLVIPDLENTSYTRIANYLERQARQRGYQLLIACSEDQPDNEMRCIEHLLQRQVDAIIVSTSLPPEHPFYQRWANDPFPIVALDRALDREHFTSVVGADQDDAEMLAEELRKFPAETVLYLGALPELSVSFLREQGFRTAWKDDPREVHFLYANSYEREAAAQLFEKWLETHPMPQALFTTSFALLQGVMDVTLRRDGKLPSDLAMSPLAITNCSTSYSARCWQWLNVTAMSQNVCWRLSWRAWTNRVSQNSLIRALNVISIAAACSAVAKPRTKVRAR